MENKKPTKPPAAPATTIRSQIRRRAGRNRLLRVADTVGLPERARGEAGQSAGADAFLSFHLAARQTWRTPVSGMAVQSNKKAANAHPDKNRNAAE